VFRNGAYWAGFWIYKAGYFITGVSGLTLDRIIWGLLNGWAGYPREILPGGTKTDTGTPYFSGPRRNLLSLFLQ